MKTCCANLTHSTFAIAAICLILAAAVSPMLFAEDEAPAAGSQPVESDMHEFMGFVFEPGYKRINAALAEKPADKKAFKGIKGDALTLAEACNLLFDRAPDEGKDIWVSASAGSRTAAASLYEAAKAGDLAAAESTWRETLVNCNKCHQKFAEDHILPIAGK